jgi:hypothetical protein
MMKQHFNEISAVTETNRHLTWKPIIARETSECLNLPAMDSEDCHVSLLSSSL